jgi:trigger factor
MNVVVENLPNCLATLRVEVEPEKVSKTMEQLVRDFTQQARIPGYRPGKAPRAVIEKRYKERDPRGTGEEALGDSTREAIARRSCACSSWRRR